MSLAVNHSPAGAEPQLDVGGATRALVRWIAMAMLAAAVAIAAVLALVGRADWWQGFAAASVLSILAAGTSVAALRVGLRFGGMGAIGGHFAGMGLRLLIVLGGGLVLVQAGGYPALPTLALAIPYYFTTLAAEVVAMFSTLGTESSQP